MDNSEEITAVEAARLLGIRDDTVRRLADGGRLPFRWGLDDRDIRCRFFRRDDLVAYLAGQAAKARERLAKLEALGEAA